jgi:hypothetical protein
MAFCHQSRNFEGGKKNSPSLASSRLEHNILFFSASSQRITIYSSLPSHLSFPDCSFFIVGGCGLGNDRQPPPEIPRKVHSWRRNTTAARRIRRPSQRPHLIQTHLSALNLSPVIFLRYNCWPRPVLILPSWSSNQSSSGRRSRR